MSGRLLLVNPPLVPSGPIAPPLAVCTLAAHLLTSKISSELRVLDLDLERRRGATTWDEMQKVFLKTLSEFDPDVVATTSMFSNSLHAERLIKLSKRSPNVVTIAGGPHFGGLPKESLDRIPELDFVVAGEGEDVLTELVRRLSTSQSYNDVGSICYRRNGTIISTQPAPLINIAQSHDRWLTAASVIPLGDYISTYSPNAPRRLMYVECGRGCPYQCSFCATAPFWRRQFRTESPKAVAEELSFLYHTYGYDSFVLIHDLPTVSRGFMTELSSCIFEARLPIQWMANSRTDIDLSGLLPILRASGCWKLFWGVESASERLQSEFKKYLDIDTAIRTVENTVSNGITCTSSFVIGFPSETTEELSSTIELAARLKLAGSETVQFHRLRIWPPSSLSMTSTQSATQFDLDSLAIEYPFIDVPPDDVEIIRRDSRFFSGFFVPTSTAGRPEDLAQVEMFFQHAIAMLPFTVTAISRALRADLVATFYEVLHKAGRLSRGSLDWAEGLLWSNWLAIRRLLFSLLDQVPPTTPLGDTARALCDYEERRLAFSEKITRTLPTILEEENCVAFESPLNLPAIMTSFQEAAPLQPPLFTDGIVVFVRPWRDRTLAYFGHARDCVDGPLELAATVSRLVDSIRTGNDLRHEPDAGTQI